MRHLSLAVSTVLILFIALPRSHAQTPAKALRVESLTTRLVSGNASSGSGVPDLRERARLILELMRHDPTGVRSLLLDDKTRQTLVDRYPEAADLLETEGSWVGDLTVLVEDDFERGESRTRRWLRVGDRMLEVHGSSGLFHSSCSSNVSVQGFRIAGEILAVSAAGSGPRAAGSCPVTGVQKTVVILAALPSMTLPALLTNSFAFSSVFGAGFSMDGFYRDASYGKTWLTGDVVGPVTLDADYDCADPSTLVKAAIKAADALVDFRNYTRVMVIAPRKTSCSIGVGLMGCTSLVSQRNGVFTASWVYLASDYLTTTDSIISVGAHEMGHNLGLGHSNTRDFGAQAIGPLSSTGTDREYYDIFSIMGLSYRIGGTIILGHFPPQQKAQLGWLVQGTDYQSVESNGTFNLSGYSSQNPGIKALRIRRGTGNNSWLWLEARQPVGQFDSTLATYSSYAYSGVLIRDDDPANATGETYLLDFRPSSTPNDFHDSPLPFGSTWDDPYTNLTLQVANGSGGLQVAATFRPPPTAAVNISTNPAGRSITVDGTAYTAPHSFIWTVNSSHDVCTTSVQQIAAGNSLAWSAWSDGQPNCHTITVPPGGSSLTATFAAQYLLATSISPVGRGSVETSPVAADGYYNAGASVTLLARPQPGGAFLSWSGDVSGNPNPASVSMDAPRSVAANFMASRLAGKVAAYNLGYWVLDQNGSFAWDGTSIDRLIYWSLGRPGEIPVFGDWNGDGRTKIGLYVDGTWRLDYNGNGVWDGPVADRLVYFGGPGYAPYVGDWNGSGTSKIAVHKDGTWLIDLDGNFAWDGPGVDKLIFFGGVGFTPVLGDWNGSGSTKIGVHKDGLWLLDFNGSLAWEGPTTDKLIFFGGPGYTPVVGDWNGSGNTKVGAQKDGLWVLDYNGNFIWDGTTTDRLIFFGGPGYIPVAGDWNASGSEKVGAYKDGLWILDVNGNLTWDPPADTLIFFGGPGQVPVVGKW